MGYYSKTKYEPILNAIILILKNYVIKYKMATTNGKQIANMLYHAGVKTFLLLGIQNLAKKILRKSATKVDLKIGDIEMLSIDILLTMATYDMLIKQSNIPADIMKYLFKFTEEKMASAVTMMIGGAVVNALAFKGGNFFIFETGQKQ